MMMLICFGKWWWWWWYNNDNDIHDFIFSVKYLFLTRLSFDYLYHSNGMFSLYYKLILWLCQMVIITFLTNRQNQSNLDFGHEFLIEPGSLSLCVCVCDIHRMLTNKQSFKLFLLSDVFGVCCVLIWQFYTQNPNEI